jgi:Uma2 family endonuclease
MGEAGIFDDGVRVELLEGMIIQMSPIGPPHAYTTQTAHDLIAATLPTGWTIRMQLPILLERSEPEPDVAVVRGKRADYKHRHPSAGDVGLLIETAESSLELDRTEKAIVYASARIPYYWIINLLERQVEVYTEPVPASGSSPARYAHHEVFGENQKVPLILDGRTIAEIPVSDLLP